MIMTESNKDEWEENMLKHMVKVFSEMGMNMDINTLKSIMEQLKDRFEDMGMNIEDMAKANVKMDANKMNINMGSEELKKMMEQIMNINNPEGFGDLLKNMGINAKSDESVIEVEAEIKDEDGMYVYKMRIKKGKNDMDLGNVNSGKGATDCAGVDYSIEDPF